VVLPRLKFIVKNVSFQEVFINVYIGDLDVHVKCRVVLKKPEDVQPKDLISF